MQFPTELFPGTLSPTVTRASQTRLFQKMKFPKNVYQYNQTFSITVIQIVCLGCR